MGPYSPSFRDVGEALVHVHSVLSACFQLACGVAPFVMIGTGIYADLFVESEAKVATAALVEPAPLQSVAILPATPLTQKEIAERVENTLRNAKYLEVTTFSSQEPAMGFEDAQGLIVGGTRPTITRSWMTENAFLTEARDEDEKLLMVFALHGGRFQEFHPNMPLRPLIEIDSLYPHAVDDVVHEREMACLFGGHTMSWVAVPAPNNIPQVYDYARSMRVKIESGVSEPDAIQDGRPCHVFRQKIPPDIENLVYVDKETFLVLRWDTINSGVHRTRINHIHKIGGRVPEGIDWKIRIENYTDKG